MRMLSGSKVGCVSITGFLAAATLCAADRPAPQALVREALHAEATGLAVRSEIIAPAKDALVQAYLGNVRQDGAWRTLDEAAKRNSGDSSLLAYAEQRRKFADDFAGNVALADWCQKRGLDTQAGAHLLRAIDFQPDNQAVRQRLGHIWTGSQWLDPKEAEAELERLTEQREANEKWMPIIANIRRRLLDSSQGRRNAAERDLKKIDDPLAIPALEAALSLPATRSGVRSMNDPGAKLPLHLIETLSGISDPRASESLARVAVMSNSTTAREAAALELGKRDPHSYIPQLLAAMRGPVQSRTTLAIEPDGRLLYRHEFMREGQERNEVAVLDTRFGRLSQSASNRQQVFAEAVQRSRNEAMRREWQAQQQRFNDEQLNDRIAWVLQAATGQSRLATPQQWWDWWNQTNEAFSAGAKPARVAYQARNVGLADPVSISLSPSVSPRNECFVAGTKVHTASGPESIEGIRVGDLVLTQNLESGELGYKPVVRTTEREPQKLMRVSIGCDTLDCTGGHLFWVLEQGWVKARDLKPGMTIHGAQSTATVSANEEGLEAPTFNLVVADDHNYFVGTGRLLTHDNTPRKPTTLVAPGVEAEK